MKFLIVLLCSSILCGCTTERRAQNREMEAYKLGRAMGNLEQAIKDAKRMLDGSEKISQENTAKP